MKNKFALIALISLLLTIIVVSSGCSQPGMTAAEAHREHVRTLRINQQEMMQDIDRTLGLDRPSRLTDKQMP